MDDNIHALPRWLSTQARNLPAAIYTDKQLRFSWVEHSKSRQCKRICVKKSCTNARNDDSFGVRYSIDVKSAGFCPRLEIFCGSSHTEELWYNVTVSVDDNTHVCVCISNVIFICLWTKRAQYRWYNICRSILGLSRHRVNGAWWQSVSHVWDHLTKVRNK